MIAPRPDQTLLSERPSRPLPMWMRVVAPMVSIFRTNSRDDAGLNSDLQSLLAKVTHCRDRAELEELLGPPDYALAGDYYGRTEPDGTELHPDLVECYSCGRLNIELWFRDNAVWHTIGFLMPTNWDFACGIET